VRVLEQQLEALDKGDGWGVLRATPVGEAAIAWTQTLGEWRRCMSRLERAGLRERHQLRKQLDRAAEREGPLRDAFERLSAPERARVRAELPEAKQALAELEGQSIAHDHFRYAHPEAMRRLERLDREIATAGWEMDLERQGLDGIAPARQEERLWGRGLRRDPPALDHGLDLGL
jgi:hypothetical protein